MNEIIVFALLSWCALLSILVVVALLGLSRVKGEIRIGPWGEKLEDRIISNHSSVVKNIRSVEKTVNMVIKSIGKGVLVGDIKRFERSKFAVCPLCYAVVGDKLETPRQSKDAKCGGCGSKVRIKGEV